MEETGLKITYAKNLSKQNFSTTISVPIDNNVNIKNILDISCYMFDERVECGSGKAIINGKIGIKVLYIDTDNITNTLSNSQTFSETMVDASITNDCFINISDCSIMNTVLSSEGVLKINCEVNISPIVYLNLGMDNKASAFENMIVKKSEIQTNTISNVINTDFEYTTNIETKDSISKILAYDSYFTPSTATAFDGYAVVEGKIFSNLLFETSENEETRVKEIRDVFNVKTEVSIANLMKDNLLDVSFKVDRSGENISTEVEDGNSIVTIKHKIKVSGVEIKSVSLDVVDDMYSTDNELELSYSTREYIKTLQQQAIVETVSNEITLSDKEPAIENIVSNMNIMPEITNSYIKDETLFFEGIITSHVVYIDENKEYKQKFTEMPFVMNSKVNLSALTCSHASVSVVDCKTKSRRGTIIELEYTLDLNLCVFEKESKEMVDNIVLGKNLDFSAYDYQIFLAKQNETMWDLCKRIKIAPEDLSKFNRNLPLVMEGGEKVVIKR